MSILDAYEPGGTPIITPKSFYDKRKKIADTAVVCFSLQAQEYVLLHYRHEVYVDFRASSNGPCPVYYLPDLGVLFLMSLIGAPSAGGILQEVAYFSGVTKFVYFGSCGVLDPKARGHFLVPTECYREEGYSYHYAPPSDYMPIKNHAYVSSFFSSKGLPFLEGRGWTTDAIYNETIKKWEKRKKEGVLCVDMEASGLQAIANHIGVEVYVFFFAGDILGESWAAGDLGGEKEKVRQVSAVEVALKLSQAIKG